MPARPPPLYPETTHGLVMVTPTANSGKGTWEGRPGSQETGRFEHDQLLHRGNCGQPAFGGKESS